MHTISTCCDHCGSSFERRVGDYRRAKKLGRKMFCNKTCAGLNRRVDFTEAKTKVCTNCGVEKPIDEFRKRMQHGRPYINAMCKICQQEKTKNQSDPEKRRKRERERRKIPEVRDKANAMTRMWAMNNPKKKKQAEKNWYKKNAEKLTDVHVKRTFRHMGIDNPTDEQIQIRRSEILKNRLIREINKLKNGKN